MDEPFWLDVLIALYRRKEVLEEHQGITLATNHYNVSSLAEQTGLSKSDIRLARDELLSLGLVQENTFEVPEDADIDLSDIPEEKRTNLVLTSKGFDVAHDWIISKRQNQFTRALVIFTAFLVIASVIPVIQPEIFQSVAVVILLVALFAVVRWSDVWE